MKLSIAYRVFFAMLLSFLVVAAIALQLARWKLLDNFSPKPVRVASTPPQDLLDDLSARYGQHHDWSFLPSSAAERRSWLCTEYLQLQQKTGKHISPTLGYRIGLLDDDGYPLAGAFAHPLTKAFASIDTKRWPLVIDGHAVASLVVAEAANAGDELAVAFLIEQQEHLFLIALLSLLLSGLAALLLAANVRKPIRELVSGAKLLENARFDTRLSVRRKDELGALAVSFNHLAAKLEDAERARNQWVADTSHELRTPLAVLRGQLEALHDGVRPGTTANLHLMLQQVLALSKLVDELDVLARADVGRLACTMASTDVWQLQNDVLHAFSERLRAASLTATISSRPRQVLVSCDAGRIRQVLTNLLENSVRYTAAGGSVEIHGDAHHRELHLSIDDSSPAVPHEMIERLGERFFRMEPSRGRDSGGAGLGLALCKKIVEAHAGRLEFRPSPLGGLRVILVLPLNS